MVLVTRNATAADVPVVYDLRAFAAVEGPVVCERTSATERNAALPAPKVKDRVFAATAVAQSITTYTVSGVRAR